MNRSILICTVVAMTILTGLLVFKDWTGVKIAPPAPQKQEEPKIQPAHPHAPKAIFHEPLTAAEVKKDLSGKSVHIRNSNHRFSGSDLKYVNICNSVCQDDSLVLEVKVAADYTVVHKRVFRRSCSHESVNGSVKMFYERKGNQWLLCKVENIDLEKKLIRG